MVSIAATGGMGTADAAAPLAAASGAPQKPHSRNFDGFSSPQAAHVTVVGGATSAVPQKPHSRNFEGFSSPHDGQAIVSTGGVYDATLRCPTRTA